VYAIEQKLVTRRKLMNCER